MRIYSSLGGEKSEFVPLKAGEVSMYVCGITPYSASHLGHGVAAIRFEMIRRCLSYSGFSIRFVQGLTNVDDKLIARGKETGTSPRAIAEACTAEYVELLTALGIEAPDANPDVISHIPAIVQYVQELIERGYAYATSEGNVYFDVRRKEGYGKLSGRSIDELLEGVRVAPGEDKRDPLDFALWKRDDHEEMSWESPWGRGRPGWHIECSVMSDVHLGQQIDIHCGGLDLIFPHHENEIAQCEAHNGCSFANYWIHSGLLTIEGRKMSKSLGNLVTLKEAVQLYGGEFIKFVVLKHHYRSDINLSNELFSDNLNHFLKFVQALRCEGEGRESEWSRELEDSFHSAIADDFHTPLALVALSDALDTAERLISDKATEEDGVGLLGKIRSLLNVLGLFTSSVAGEDQVNILLRVQARLLEVSPLSEGEVKGLIEERRLARAERDFRRADEIRDVLLKNGIKVMDSQTGPTKWMFELPSKE